jgi:pimeloyl-ACP methyl ester carboxylesterase
MLQAHRRPWSAEEDMATFVLVHGAWHGGWCWHKIVPLLEAKGHRVLAPDLPGLGEDHTPLADLSLAGFSLTTFHGVHTILPLRWMFRVTRFIAIAKAGRGGKSLTRLNTSIRQFNPAIPRCSASAGR